MHANEKQNSGEYIILGGEETIKQKGLSIIM